MEERLTFWIVALCALLLALQVAPATEAGCDFQCVYVKWAQLYECRIGPVLAECHTGGSTCWGVRCTSNAETGAPTDEWTPLPAEIVTEIVGADLARLFADLWEYQSDAGRLGRPGIPEATLAGGVVIDGEPHEFTLVLQRSGDAESYLLDVEGWGRVELVVRRLENAGDAGPMARVVWNLTTVSGATRTGFRDVPIPPPSTGEKTWIVTMS